MASGYKARAACKRPAETSVHGDAASGITNQLPFTAESFSNDPTHDTRTDLVNSPSSKDSELIAMDDTGGMSFETFFEGLEYIFFAAMGFQCPTVYTGNYGAGSGGSPAPTGDGAFYHLFQLDDNLHREAWAAGDRDASSGIDPDPEYWTANDKKVRCVDMCIDKEWPAGMVHRHINAMVNKLTWKLTTSKVTLDVDFISHKNNVAGDGDKASWAMPANNDRCLFPNSNIYIASIGNDLSTKYGVQEIELSLENNLSQDRETATAANEDSKFIIESKRTATRKVSGRIKLARFSTEQWDTWMDDDLPVQMIVEHIGPTIPGSSSPFSLRWLVPQCKITKASFPVAGPGVITGDIEFTAEDPLTTSFTWLTDLLGGIDDIKQSELMLLLCNTTEACVARDRQASGVSLP